MLDFVLNAGEPVFRLAGVIGVFLVIVFIHEMGHYLVGRWCGIGASAFSVGFGAELFGYTDKRGTRWKLSAIPLGGYVKFIGDQNAASMPVESRTGENLRPDSFAAANVWKRIATVFAGPFFNGLLAVVVLSALALSYGRFVLMPVVDSVLPDSPAAAAGFKPNDRIVTMQGEKIVSFDEVLRYIRTHEEENISFEVKRNGSTVLLNVVPRINTVHDELGTVRVGQIGIMFANKPEYRSKVTYSFLQAVDYGVQETGYIVQQTGRFFLKLFQGRADRCQVSGPVQSAQIAWKVSDMGFIALLNLMALFSVSIGLLNLFPLPPLDGGHLVFYLIEAATGRPVPPAVQEKIFFFGFMLVLLLIVLATVNNFIPC